MMLIALLGALRENEKEDTNREENEKAVSQKTSARGKSSTSTTSEKVKMGKQISTQSSRLRDEKKSPSTNSPGMHGALNFDDTFSTTTVQKQSMKSSTTVLSNSRIRSGSTNDNSSNMSKRKRSNSTPRSEAISPTILSSSSSKPSDTSASRIVKVTPETTQIALHALKEYSEFNNVFRHPNAKTNVRHFYAYITDLGKHYNSKNTPQRELTQKKLTKIEDTTTICKIFGVGIGVRIVNAVRDIIVLQIPKIISESIITKYFNKFISYNKKKTNFY
jgi:hypothetical protein